MSRAEKKCEASLPQSKKQKENNVLHLFLQKYILWNVTNKVNGWLDYNPAHKTYT